MELFELNISSEKSESLDPIELSSNVSILSFFIEFFEFLY